MEKEEIIEKKRVKLPIKILLVFITLIAILFYYMHFIETRLFTTHEYAVINELLPDSFNGFKIVQFSDIHFGRTTNEKEVQRVIKKIIEMKADIVVFSGDLLDSYINLSDENKIFLKEELGKITANIGKYAIMGDSDYLDELAYKEIMEFAHFTILDNQNIPIFYKGTTPIFLNGISSLSKGKQDYTKSFEKDIEGTFFQISLIHEPIAFSSIKNQANFVLAGHSLGGLIRIPFIDRLINKNNVGDYENGMYVNEDSTLFVSNGIGTEDISLRFGNVPSINLYRLYNYK